MSLAYFALFGIPKPIEEYRFHPTRRWRFDFAWPRKLIAVEVEGGLWNYGRHNRAPGYIKDLEKYNHANLLGWHVFRFQPSDLKINKTEAGLMIKQALDGKIKIVSLSECQ